LEYAALAAALAADARVPPREKFSYGGSDLRHLSELDPKLWTALSCPVNDLEIDRKTLQIIDSDKDGQIRVPEVIEAVNWVVQVLRNTDDLLKQAAVFPLSAINDQTEEGKALLDSAYTILRNLGKEITVVPDHDLAGIELVDRAVELGWAVSIPNWPISIKDVNDAVVRMGRLATMITIFQARETTKLKIELRKKQLVKRIRT
jgi:hypothetical protein